MRPHPSFQDNQCFVVLVIVLVIVIDLGGSDQALL